jgi:hypothetical protein
VAVEELDLIAVVNLHSAVIINSIHLSAQVDQGIALNEVTQTFAQLSISIISSQGCKIEFANTSTL